MNRKILTLAIVGLAISTFAVDAQTVQLRGYASCGQWVAGNSGRPYSQFTNRAWLLGYLSGLASTSRKDILNGVDNESIFLWVDNYCQTNPLGNTINAGGDLFKALANQKGL